jgi:(p)ppGpp synthase/HD superfamily hydrolase
MSSYDQPMAPLARPLSDRFDAAVLFAHRVHRDQARKGTDTVPYIAHLFGVTALVLEYKGDETQAIAALLHDAIEDAPPTLGGAAGVRREIHAQFGDEVLEIVEHCTDTDEQPKPPWIARKHRYIEHVPQATERALLVSASDKLHNVQSVLRDYRRIGDQVWDRFNKDAGRTGTLGYYRALVEAFRPRLQNPIVADLDRTLRMLETEAGGPCPWPP